MSDIIYKFISHEFAIKVLEEGKLKVSHLKDLNDAFDCAPVIPMDHDSTPPGLGYWSSGLWLKKWYETYGLICFSKTFCSPLLWGHYAACGKGLALGFDPQHFRWNEPIDIDYKDKTRPVLRVTKGQELIPETQAIRTCFDKKAQEWGYEQEVRYLVELVTCEPRSGLYFATFPRDSLKEVIIGINSMIKPTYFLHLLNAYYKDLNVQLYTARIHPNLYEITKEEARHSWPLII